MKKTKEIIFPLAMVFMCGCAANQLSSGAASVDILEEAPNKSECKFVGEVIGSQGNWFTGGYTSNKNLMVGARNSIKNEAYKLGANSVYIQQSNNSSTEASGGTTNTTLIGKAYKCKN